MNTTASSCILMKTYCDTNTIRDCLFWKITGTGIEIPYGAEVRIKGGRIWGVGNRHDNSIGIHVTGNNGGVHIDTTDVNGLQTGLLLDNSSGYIVLKIYIIGHDINFFTKVSVSKSIILRVINKKIIHTN